MTVEHTTAVPQQRKHAADDVLDALRRYARVAATPSVPELHPAEQLELARLWLHRKVDDAIDDEALHHPSPYRLIARTSRWIELHNALRDAA